MGLIENLSRGVQKAGIIPKLNRLLPLISVLCAVCGLAWLAILPMDGQFRNTYISENALLPHQASTHFRESEWEVTRAYMHVVKNLEFIEESERNTELARHFRDLGLKTTTVDWSCDLPFGKMGNKRGDSGETLYSVLHAPRGSSNEAIVIVAPWFTQTGDFNKGGVALLLALARYYTRWTVWQKNIILVLPTNSHVALRSWVRDYHTSLQNTAGSIEGTIVLDFSVEGEFFEHIEVFYDGLNGQLPNLDLINTVVKVADEEHVASEILGMGMNYYVYKQRLLTLLQGMYRQLMSGLVIGPGSEMFSGWRIDAVTIKAKGTKGPHDITTFGRVIESTTRSINNLLEHFHQSFFFYLMMGPRYFVSIGTYLPSAMLVASSYVIMAGYYFGNSPFDQQDIVPSIGVFAAMWLISSLMGFLAILGAPSMFVLFCIYVNVLVQLYFARSSIGPGGLYLQYAYSLTVFSLGLTVLATLNFSTSLLLATVCLPLAWIKPRAGWTQRNILAIVGSSPVSIWLAITYWFNLPYRGVLITLISAHVEVGAWHWRLVHTLWLPMWLSSVLAITSEPEEVAVTKEEYEKYEKEEIEGSLN